jgi:hypothetical protein
VELAFTLACRHNSNADARLHGRNSIFEQAFCSEGTIENSPAFQCRERFGEIESRRDGWKETPFSTVPAGLDGDKLKLKCLSCFSLRRCLWMWQTRLEKPGLCLV